jgi:hypothetical protein
VPDTPIAPVPLDLLQQIPHELRRTSEAFEAYHREALPLIKKLADIEEARDRARAAADAERLEGRGRFTKIATSTPAYMVYTAIVVLLANYLAAVAGIAPQVVKDGLAPETEEVRHAAEP